MDLTKMKKGCEGTNSCFFTPPLVMIGLFSKGAGFPLRDLYAGWALPPG